MGVVHATARVSVTGERDAAIMRVDLRCRVVAICVLIRDVFCSEIRSGIATNFGGGRGPACPRILRVKLGTAITLS